MWKQLKCPRPWGIHAKQGRQSQVDREKREQTIAPFERVEANPKTGPSLLKRKNYKALLMRY